LFAVLVGDTSRARKGTVRANVQRFYALVDSGWAESRVSTGLTTGEGLIKAVCEPDITGPSLPYDTWLLDVEPEFSRVLSTAARDGSTLSATLRQAWDQEHLQVMTRKDPLIAKKAHISMIAHITTEEIQRKLNDVEIANGFANRFLFAAVRRSRFLPSGGNPDETRLKKLALQVHRRLTDARTCGRLVRTPSAEDRWQKIYVATAEERQSGLIDAVTARAEAQMLRLSIVYAVLDGSRKIEEEHVDAALAVWAYCRDSARLIFGDHVGYPLAQHLMKAIRAAGPTGLTRVDMHARLGRHTKGEDIRAAVDHLRGEGKIDVRKVPTAGRSKEVAVAREFEVSHPMGTARAGTLPSLPSPGSLISVGGGQPGARTSLSSDSSHSSLVAASDEPESGPEELSIARMSEEIRRDLEKLSESALANGSAEGEVAKRLLTPEELLALVENTDDD
jgi:hypothetical protein